MNINRQVLSYHAAAIILAAITAFIVAFPQLYFRFEHRNDGIYQGIELLPDSPWSARVREIQDGHGFGSIYYKDGKSDPYLHTPLGSIIVAYLGEAFILNINDTILLSRLALSALAFLVIYFFVYLISKDRLASLASASVILLADAILDYSGIPRLWTETWQGIPPSSFLEIARPVYPLMIFVPFFGFLASFWKYLRQSDWRWGLLSAVILGSSFYNYLYLWTYLYAFGALLVLIYFFQKKREEIKKTFYVLLGALLLGIPYAVNLYRAQAHPFYEELGARHGIVFSHEPTFVGAMVILSLVAFFALLPRQDRDKYAFSLALLITPFLTLNQQVITGRILQEGHYHWYFHKPIAVIFLIVAIFHFLARRDWHFYKKTLATLIIATSFATGVFIQAASYFSDYEGRDGGYTAIERQKYGPAVKWLSENVPKETVVLANNEASQMVVIYTSLNVFHHRSAQLFLAASEERLLDAVFTFYRLGGVGTSGAEEAFKADIKNISANVYGIYYREALGSYGAIPDEKFREILARYQKTLETPTSIWLRDIFRKYEVEYFIWDKSKDPAWDLDRLNYLEQVAEFGTMAIYKLHQ
jgi:hypothetical protein